MVGESSLLILLVEALSRANNYLSLTGLFLDIYRKLIALSRLLESQLLTILLLESS